MTRHEKIIRVIQNGLDGYLTYDQCRARLDAYKVRGGWETVGVPAQYDDAEYETMRYTGYDYQAQQWIQYP